MLASIVDHDESLNVISVNTSTSVLICSLALDYLFKKIYKPESVADESRAARLRESDREPKNFGTTLLVFICSGTDLCNAFFTMNKRF